MGRPDMMLFLTQRRNLRKNKQANHPTQASVFHEFVCFKCGCLLAEKLLRALLSLALPKVLQNDAHRI